MNDVIVRWLKRADIDLTDRSELLRWSGPSPGKRGVPLSAGGRKDHQGGADHRRRASAERARSAQADRTASARPCARSRLPAPGALKRVHHGLPLSGRSPNIPVPSLSRDRGLAGADLGAPRTRCARWPARKADDGLDYAVRRRAVRGGLGHRAQVHGRVHPPLADPADPRLDDREPGAARPGAEDVAGRNRLRRAGPASARSAPPFSA